MEVEFRLNAASLYPYERDVLSVKKYGDYNVRISLLSSCRVSGYEEEKKKGLKCTVNDCKLDNNLSRAKSNVYELAFCNLWQYWCTFTLDEKKINRYDLDNFIKVFSEFIHNLNRRRESKVMYLLVPEMHDDGAWHMHGFIKGLLDSDLCPTGNFDKETGEEYFTWKKYHDKFGFMSFSKIRDLERASKYCLKYMTKDNSRNVTKLGAHLYYHSHGLNKAERIFKGKAEFHGEWDWIHPEGYVKCKDIDLRETALEECIEVMQ